MFKLHSHFPLKLHVQFYIHFNLFSRSVCYFLIWLQPHVQIASSCCDTQHEDAMFVLQIRILHVQTAAPWPNCNFMTTLQPHNLIATSCSDCIALFFFFPCVSQAVCPSAFMVAVCGPRVMNSAWWEGEITGGRGAGRGGGVHFLWLAAGGLRRIKDNDARGCGEDDGVGVGEEIWVVKLMMQEVVVSCDRLWWGCLWVKVNGLKILMQEVVMRMRVFVIWIEGLKWWCKRLC